jgi:uncharacterized membrane protein
MAQAESQTAHRLALEKRVIGSDIWRSYIGLGLGFIISMTCVIGGIWLVAQGHDTAGTTVATGSVAALAGVFVYGALTRRSERREKAEATSAVRPRQGDEAVAANK